MGIGIVEYILIGVAVILASVIGYVGLDWATGTTKSESAMVVERLYQPSSTTTGLATGVGANGQVATGLVTTSESEKYTLILDMDGEIFSKTVSATTYAKAKPGETITLAFRYGGLSGSRL